MIRLDIRGVDKYVGLTIVVDNTKIDIGLLNEEEVEKLIAHLTDTVEELTKEI
jgi:hypothetical protein